MRKIAPVIFNFSYVKSATSEASVKNTYRRLFAIAERNLIAKGLLSQQTYKDVVSGQKNIVDTTDNQVYSGSRANNYGQSSTIRGVSNNRGVCQQTENFQGDGLSNDKAEGDTSSEGGRRVEN